MTRCVAELNHSSEIKLQNIKKILPQLLKVFLGISTKTSPREKVAPPGHLDLQPQLVAIDTTYCCYAFSTSYYLLFIAGLELLFNNKLSVIGIFVHQAFAIIRHNSEFGFMTI